MKSLRKPLDLNTSRGWNSYDRITTAEGDRLNLRSPLSQYLFSVMSGNRELLQNGEIECQEAADYQMLEGYFRTFGNVD